MNIDVLSSMMDQLSGVTRSMVGSAEERRRSMVLRRITDATHALLFTLVAIHDYGRVVANSVP